MTLIEKTDLLNFWNAVEYGGLKKIVPEPGNPIRERGAPMTAPEEIEWLINRLEENINEVGPINTIIELGVCDGGTMKIWEQVLLSQNKDTPFDALYIGVDCGPCIQWNWQKSPIDIRIVTGDTFNPKVREQVKNILIEKGNGKRRPVDFLFQDASHTSEGVKNDFLDYGAFVGENRIIGFHDTRLFRSFWDEFTGNGIDACDDPKNPNYNERALANERAVFHKEEFKVTLGTGLFWNIPTQNVIKFKDVG